MAKIYDVVVNKISLITGGKIPAVPSAETKFAIMKAAVPKMDGVSLERIESVCRRLEKVASGADDMVKDGGNGTTVGDSN